MTRTTPLLPRSEDAPYFLAPQHGPRPLPLFLAHLWRESENDPVLRQKALTGLRLYQRAKRPETTHLHSVSAQRGAARLLHPYRAQKSAACATVLVPSLINPPHILDMGGDMSLMRYLAERGHDPWLMDWGTPADEDRDMDLGAHITQRLLPLLAQIDGPVILVGYCLGGTMALAAARMIGAQGAATIASPWHFGAYPDEDRALIARIWAETKPLCERLGYMPMEVLQSGFWALDTARTVRKYAAFADMEPGGAAHQAFLAVEDWANDGPPLSFAAARELFEDLYGADLTGEGRWSVGGEIVDPASLPCPSLSIRSMTDRIVPAAASPTLADEHGSTLGHVGMIVSRHAPQQIWLILSQWLSENGG